MKIIDVSNKVTLLNIIYSPMKFYLCFINITAIGITMLKMARAMTAIPPSLFFSFIRIAIP
jgi:hypothetical protein